MPGQHLNQHGRFDKVENDIAEIKLQQVEMKSQQTVMLSQQKENTSILKALEHKAEVHKAELDKLNVNVAKLSGEVKEI